MKMKNVLLVMVVILVPIIIMGAFAVSGAERFHEMKQAAEEGHTSEAAAPMVGVEAEQPLALENTAVVLSAAPGGLT